MKVLVANRGEIAVRLVKSCKSLQFHSTAIYSQEDGKKFLRALQEQCDIHGSSPHVRLADDAVSLDASGAAAYLDSYSENILRICKERDIDVVIPGYGFLSENNEFAAMLHTAGIKFAGPDPETIIAFGLKHRARELAVQADVPVVPGTDLITTLEDAANHAQRLGYPVMVKATAGGGGMGLTVCRTPGELSAAVDTVRSRGATLFKDSGLFLEKYIAHGRHIEGQIFGNGQGDVLWLGERECSLQRRHQKVVEESPSPFVLRHPELRKRLEAASLSLAKSVHYKSAGTVEFLVDDDTGDFYFLEMNTRLQVEHGVTELCYDVDIVNMMLLQAEAEVKGHIGLTPNELAAYERAEPRGHAIEVRVYAENPADDHKPAPGLFTSAAFPIGDGIRVDTWVERGSLVTPFFDPLLAKVMTHAASRHEAIALMKSTLAGTSLHGPPTNLKFLQSLLEFPDVSAGNTLTSTLSKLQFKSHSIEFRDGGLYTTVQDYPGRPHRQSGVPVAGPMDSVSFRVANMLVGNPLEMEGLEITYAGPTMIFHQAAVIALCGADFEFSINGRQAELWSRHLVPQGAEVIIGSQSSSGCRAYLGILGGFPDIDAYLGSKSTTPALKWGGFQGRTLRAGDILQISSLGSEAAAASRRSYTLPKELRPVIDTTLTIKALPGPYDSPEFVTPDGMEEFYNTAWTVAFSSSRGGLRLDGPAPKWSRDTGGEGGSHPSNVLGYGFPTGGFSFTGDSAVIFTADSPVQSGFISLTTVLSCELWKLGQLKPGDTVQFSPCSWQQAVSMERELERSLETIATAIYGRIETTDGLSKSSTESSGPQNSRTLSSSVLYERKAKDDLPRFVLRQAGDRGLLCDFGSQVFDLVVRVHVQRIVQSLWDSPPSGFQRLSRPHTMSVLVNFDPTVLDQKTAVSTMVALETSFAQAAAYKLKTKLFHLPMVFDADENKVATERYMKTQRPYATYLPDNIDFIRRNNGLASRDDVRKAVEDVPFVVLSGSGNMGMPIMVQVDPRVQLVVPKANPSRTTTPAGALGIGGKTFALYPSEQPGGYMLYGLTIPGCPFDTFGLKPNYTPSRPWLFEPFDQIIFHEVSREEFESINHHFQMGLYEIEATESVFDLAEYKALVERTRDEVRELQERQNAAARTELAKENKLLEQWRTELAQNKAEESLLKGPDVLDPKLIRVVANMNAKIWKRNIAEGSVVSADDVLIVLEAMKMEIAVRAPRKAQRYKVKLILKNEGDLVNPGDVLVALEQVSE